MVSYPTPLRCLQCQAFLSEPAEANVVVSCPRCHCKMWLVETSGSRRFVFDVSSNSQDEVNNLLTVGALQQEDSVELIELAIAMEAVFRVTAPNWDYVRFRRKSDVLDFYERALNAGST